MTGLKKQHIPIHDFSPEDDLGNLHMRYVSLHVHNDYDFSEPHRHRYYELFFFRKGGGSHVIDFVEYPVADSSLHIVAPGQVHLLKRAPASYGAVIHLHKESAMHLPQVYNLLQMCPSPVFNHSTSLFSEIEIILKQLEGELSLEEHGPDIVTVCLWHLLLKSVVRQSADGRGIESRAGEHFAVLKKMVEEQYRNNRLPTWYADQLCITEKRLNEICKEAIGTTAGAFLKDRVLLEAKRLLSHSSGSVKEIGYYLGFDDPAYFARFFKKNLGITAGEFRAMYQNQSRK